jgi:DNA-directed RNA polymerase specialized sigma24 family protein
MARPDMDAAAAIEELDREAGSPDAGTILDAKWRLACHIAAERHVLEKSAISDQSREVYRLSSVEGLSNGQIAKRLGLKENAVRRIKSRVAAMVEAIERTLYE